MTGRKTARAPYRWRLSGLLLGLALLAAPGLGHAGKPVPTERSTPRAHLVARAPLTSRLELAAGPVTLHVGTKATRVDSGAALPVDARLEAGAGARALARLPDGASVFLRGGTTVALGEREVTLERGELWIDAPKTESGTAVFRMGDVTLSTTDAGVSLRRDADGRVEAYVARGLAVLTAPGGRVEVQTGERAVTSGTAAPEVSSVLYWEDWTGGMADNPSARSTAGAGVLYGIDVGAPAGALAQPLDVARLDVRTVIRAELAQTAVDQTFVNHGDRDLEGWYWFTVPPGATVSSFAVEMDGRLVEGAFIERQEAAAGYTAAVASGREPAILEWVDARTFRARIHPVPAMGSRRVVLRYLEPLPVRDGMLRFHYPLHADQPRRIGEFSLSVDLGEVGTQMAISTLAEARIEDGGQKVTMRRSGFTPRADFQLEATLTTDLPPVRVSRHATGPDTADYVMVRYDPDVDWAALDDAPAEVVVVVDTSGGGDDTSRQLRLAAAEAILRALSPEDRFALVSLDVDAQVLYPATGLAAADDTEITAALEHLADHSTGGATDLATFFDVALGRLHDATQPAVVYVGDGRATSGDLSADQLRERLRRSLSTSPARLFTVGVGPEADEGLLEELARTGGGRSYQIDDAGEATERALRLTAQVKTPTITGLELDLGPGHDDVFVSGGGKVSRGEEVILLARTHNDLPKTIRVTGTLAGKPFARTYTPFVDDATVSSYVPRFWAQEYIRQLLGTAADVEQVRGEVAQLGIAHGLMTPYTSILALDSAAAYAQLGVEVERQAAPLVDLRTLTEEVVTTGDPATASPAYDDYKTVVTVESRRGGPRSPSPSRKPEPSPTPTSPSPSQTTEPTPTSPPPIRAKDRYDARVDDHVDASTPTATEVGTYSAATLARFLVDAVPGTCSDWANRPLSDRRVQWEKRLDTAISGADVVDRYASARRACEVPDWEAEQELLRLMARHLSTEADVTVVLESLSRQAGAQRVVASELLRGATDPHVIDAVRHVLFGDAVDWDKVDRELAAIKGIDARIEACRRVMTLNPDDPEGTVRLIRLLVAAGHTDEVLVQSRRLQDRGMMTPLLAREMGDVLAAQGLADEALRTYSEIVEFQPENAHSRQLLGDIYLAHGWYGQAYRQYRTMVDGGHDGASVQLRLAAAAAGEGRVDEALRIERQVATSPGSPGVDDPRGWARLASAARIATLLDALASDPDADPKLADSLRRRLKELELFHAPGTLVVVTWEALDADLALVSTHNGAEVVVGNPTDAHEVGLAALLAPTDELERVDLGLRVRTAPREGTARLVRHDIHWDGSTFRVDIAPIELREGASMASL